MPDVCPRCNADGWHMGWCPGGPGPSPRGEGGLGTGRRLLDFEERRQREVQGRIVEKEE